MSIANCSVRFWGKLASDGAPGISAGEHMLNVGHVARLMAELSPALCRGFGLSTETIAALAALHDLGKISPGFQQKCPAWLEIFGLSNLAAQNGWGVSTEKDHGRVSHASIQKALMELGVSRKTAKFLAAVLGAHHGGLKERPSDRGISCVMSEPVSGIDWDKARIDTVRELWTHFDADTDFTALSISEAALWWLGGLTSVADWIGSNERFFSADVASAQSRESAATAALEEIGLGRLLLRPGLSFKSIFSFEPNELQVRAGEVITQPGVYLIEAPMGVGKTEAALWAAYRLLSAGLASGVYFALPTQSTSNRIHLRMNDFLRLITANGAASRLVHGNSWLVESDGVPERTGPVSQELDSGAQVGRDWLASPKRALLASFGVGTVDQCLLGVVAAKHFFVRHYALSGKVVILDEIHTYDLYTGTLIDKLIDTLGRLGCTVIILSATLTGKRCGQLLAQGDAAPSNVSERLQPYPLISGRTAERVIPPVAVTPSVNREVRISFSPAAFAMSQAKQLAEVGGSVLWICDTVDSAQRVYRELVAQCGGNFPIGLLHSRFTFPRREALEQEWMVRLGKNGTRCGSILVASQVVEQSVDIDADLLITELAPTDMLLQRIGRLWRHFRKIRPVANPTVLIIEERASLEALQRMSPVEIVETFGPKAKVYSPYILLRTLELWKSHEQISIPGQIRSLLETTYSERSDEPEAWQRLGDDDLAKTMAHRMLALQNSNYWNVELRDEEGLQTRQSEIMTIPLILCSEHSQAQSVLLGGEIVSFSNETHVPSAARAIHRNLVKIPVYLLSNNRRQEDSGLSRYVQGSFAVGVVDHLGNVSVVNMRPEIHLTYSDTTGLIIRRSS